MEEFNPRETQGNMEFLRFFTAKGQIRR